MKKLLFVLCILMIAAPLVNAQSLKFSAGAFGGVSVPLVQDDQDQGLVFGIMGRFSALNIITLEPNLSMTKWGEPGDVDGLELDIDGSKITSFGLNALIGGAPGVPGLKPYFLGGIGYFKIKNDDTGFDEGQIGYTVGLGISVGIMSSIELDIRATGIIIPIEDSSKKAANITAGILYNFGLGK